MTVVKEDNKVAVVPSIILTTVERSLLLPLAFVSGVHFLGLIPLNIFNHTSGDTCLLQCLSLLLLGMFFSALATLNFSLSFLVGLCAAPLTFIRPISPSSPTNRRIALAALQYALLVLLSPVTVVGVASQELVGKGLRADDWVGVEAVVVWLVWWPAWFVGAVVVSGSFFGS
ncbi:Gaa1-like GPI transamidase component [Botryosphaeria dothidea]|uniref:Gaa1-like GPI transamidase component n=1 Tax=Botryosphaeria dothidea TaxID=55169 RepID=A0A8H4N2R9_9PEZI|nr:Gaa1-like GPI transamidase component [Botryosphaeria dothidea]